MKTLTFLAFALVLFSGFTQAFGFNFYNQDFEFEVYSGERYTPVATPYTYTTYVNSTPYYYFDYPYRVYSNNSYSYFQPGWYSFYTSNLTVAPDIIVSNLAIAPDVIDYGYYQYGPSAYLHYSYLPSTYYYYDNSWAYYPSWVYTYGPAYYGSYYYPPSDATLVGQTYQPAQEAFCTDVDFSAGYIDVYSGSSRKGTIYLNNYSGKYLDLHNVSIIPQSPYVEIRNIKFDKIAYDNSSARIDFDVFAEGNLTSGEVPATVSINGTFRDGTYCNSATSQDFLITVIGNAARADEEEEKNIYNTKTFDVSQGSVAYFRPMDDFDNSDMANFQDYPDYKKDTDFEDTSSVNVITNSYNEKQTAAQNCEALSIETENITVNSGSSKTAYFSFKNYAGEDFYIDRIEAKEYNPDFSIEATRDSKTVFAGQAASIKVRAFAQTEKSGTGSGYIAINGHYLSGLECAKTSRTFFVTTVAQKPQGKHILTVPSKAELKGNSGFLVFGLENNTQETLRVLVSAKNVDVSEDEFVFGPNTKGERTIALNDLRGQGKVYYKIYSNDAVLEEKFTSVVKIGEINVDGNIGTKPKETKDALPDFNNFVAGLFTLSDSGILLGILAVIVLIAIALLLPRQEEEKKIIVT